MTKWWMAVPLGHLVCYDEAARASCNCVVSDPISVVKSYGAEYAMVWEFLCSQIVVVRGGNAWWSRRRAALRWVMKRVAEECRSGRVMQVSILPSRRA